MKPYSIHIPDSAIDDLNRRLDASNWPSGQENAGWDHGASLEYLKELTSYWRNQFDWRSAEARLNEVPQYTATIQGLEIHFVHIKGRGPNAIPLLISHGWPSSFIEMHKIIPLLSNPQTDDPDSQQTFDLVIPSLPGFAFSETSLEGGMDLSRIADIFDELMLLLGYEKYATHGGDIGAGVCAAIGLRHPDHVYGAHVTSVALVSPWIDPQNPALTVAENDYTQGRRDWMASEGAYYMIQSTKPQTLSFGLSDSPVGLAAWIVEKFRAWSDCDGDLETRFSKDDLLTNISLYWFTGCISSANRFYYENRIRPLALKDGQIITGANGLSVFPADISIPPREWAERSFRLQHYSHMPRGGHFSAFEEPELLAQEIRSTFRMLESTIASSPLR